MTTEDYFDHNPPQHFSTLLTKQAISVVDKELYDRDSKTGDNGRDGDYGHRHSIDYVLTFDSYVSALHSILRLYRFDQVIYNIHYFVSIIYVPLDY